MPVAQSSHVQQYEYDPETRTITIQFVNGAVYAGRMDQTEYDNFHQTGSKGAYVQYKLKDRLTKVQSAPPAQRKRMKYGRDY